MKVRAVLIVQDETGMIAAHAVEFVETNLVEITSGPQVPEDSVTMHQLAGVLDWKDGWGQ